ncbi:WSSV403 [White spot syndrome virus]|uniref:WSSV403 n=1 Tax=White spot syndrome virus TaxID=342409 RepID=A0A2I6SC96_9VIRU|nr:WSSV403 [White spot syndrome virus]
MYLKVCRTKIESEAKNSVTSSPEKVFSVEDLEIYSKGQVCKGLKLNANCSRIGGKYAVSMSIKNTTSPHLRTTTKFSEEPRDCFMLEITYPLVGFKLLQKMEIHMQFS